MQVDTAHLAGRPVEEFGGYVLGYLAVVTLLLPSAYEVVAFFFYHAVELRHLVRAVLQVGIHGDDHIALCGGESGVKGGALAVVAAELNATIGVVLCVQFLCCLPGAVVRAVVDYDNLIADTPFRGHGASKVGDALFHHTVNPFCQVRQRLCFVVRWYYY